MRPGDDHELLSAYLDREVTPSERAEVEAHLDASPDARAELDALAELSLCLRTLDRPTAPADLHASVMRAVAGRRPAATALPVTPPARRKPYREWLVSLVAVASTAAAILMAVTSWNPTAPSTPSTMVRSDSTTGAVMNAPTAADFANDFALSKHDENQPRNRFVGDATFREDHVRMGSPAAAGDLALSAPAVPRPVAPSAAIPEALQESDDTRVMQETAGKSLEKVALNQFLEIWASTDAPDRYVANIDLQVLDVKQSADKFQVLLLKNGVATLENRELAEAKVAAGSPARGSPKSEPRENKGTNTNDDGSMIAVYVDTTADRVTKSLEELAKQHDVLGVRLQPPLALARLADDAIAPQAAVVSESLLRAELDDVTSAYANNQYFLAQDLLDEEGPVDALRVLPSAKAVPADNERLKQLVTERAAMRQQRARTWNTVEKEGVARSKDNNFGANSLSIGNTLNYSSVVKLPIANGFESAPAGAATSNTVLDAKPEPPLAVAQRRSTPALSELNANTAPAGRQRNAYNQAAANPVRLLVIFQDPMEDSQGKTPHP